MNEMEFYIFENELWCMHDGKNEVVKENDVQLIKEMLGKIREFYPEAYADLEKWFKKSSFNVPYFQYLIVDQFSRCNFGNLDNGKKDVDSTGCFHFERVNCPMRGRCTHENVVCNPKFNTNISPAEMRVMELMYDGMSVEDAADRLYLSPNTVKNHIKSVYLKLGIHGRSEFVLYANKNNLFNK